MDKVVWTNALGSNIGDCIYFAEFSKVIILRNTNRSVSIAMKIYIFVNSRLWLTFPIFIVVWPSSVCSLPPFLALHRSLRGEYCGGCRRSNSTEQPHAFQVILTERPPLELSADNEGDMADWMLVLCQSVSKGVRVRAYTHAHTLHSDTDTHCTVRIMRVSMANRADFAMLLPWGEENPTRLKTYFCMNCPTPCHSLSPYIEFSSSRFNQRFTAENWSFSDF